MLINPFCKSRKFDATKLRMQKGIAGKSLAAEEIFVAKSAEVPTSVFGRRA